MDQNILSVPMAANPVPVVDKGYDTQTLNCGIAPNEDPYSNPTINNRKNDTIQYCNILPSAPRDQLANVPYLGTNCDTNPNYYNKDRCYLVSDQAQGIPGIVCDQPGGSNNSDFVRGNQFGVNYPNKYDIFDEKKKLEYTVENPVQLGLEMENPMVIYDSNTFYPYPTMKYGLNKSKDFLTYPLEQNFTKTGLPTYTYPYKVLNPYPKENVILQNLVENFEQNVKANSIPAITKFILIITLIIIMLITIAFIKR